MARPTITAEIVNRGAVDYLVLRVGATVLSTYKMYISGRRLHRDADYVRLADFTDNLELIPHV